MPKLTDDEFNGFLADRGIVMKIAVVRADGSPLVTPLWFIHRDGAIWFTPREKSEWFGCLRRDPRVALCIDDQNLPYRKVLVEGRAEMVHDLGEDDAWRDLYRDIARRYISDRAAEEYVQNTIDQPRGLFRVVLADAKVKSWRLPLKDEPTMGIWAGRYYQPGTQF
ncbi:MAG: pyridoxamine 5'-phosphate oxidase family protein [Pseudomonadota bacterium]|nr:pyridoxamine 5'-phosphate oxidase family protein [Pseudomonadota bacterium]